MTTKSSKKNLIHPTAIVSEKAQIAHGVEIGPYCIIGDDVTIGQDTKLSSHVHIEGKVTIGQRCKIFTGVVLGAEGQIKNHKAVNSELQIGDDNVIREYVTIHSGSKDGSKTIVGNRNILMVSTHIAHDCIVGSDIMMANLATLGGHVQVEDFAVIGGLTGVHQFVRIGKYAMVGGISKLVMDVPPYSMVDGRPAIFCGINAVGMRRAGISSSQRLLIKKVLKQLFATGSNLSSAVKEIEKEYSKNADIQSILNFIKNSKRGLVRGEKQIESEEE